MAFKSGNFSHFVTIVICFLIINGCKKDENVEAEVKLAPNGYNGGSVAKPSAEAKIASISQYHLYLPDGYKENNNTYPVIIFLHGGGAKGDQIAQVTASGTLPGYALKNQDFPFIVISPQLASNYPEWDTSDLQKFYNDVINDYRIDKGRIYISGYSIGGIAAWRFASANPEYFAAAAPIGCYGDLSTVCKMKDVPVWAFHNRFDFSYTLSAAEQTITAYDACATEKAKFTVFDDTGHEGWTKAYNNPDLYIWLSSKRKK